VEPSIRATTDVARRTDIRQAGDICFLLLPTWSAFMPDLADCQSIEIQGSAARPYTIKNVGGVYSP